MTEPTESQPEKLVHLKFIFNQIGDQVCTTGLPEIIYKKTNTKSVITDPLIWVFKHNTYVVFMTEEEAKDLPIAIVQPDTRHEDHRQKYMDTFGTQIIHGQLEFMSTLMGIPGIHLRHPRLYLHEDSEIIPHKIVVHTTGSDRTRLNEVNIRTHLGEDNVRVMSDEIISAILKNYKNFKIIQIGGKDDKPLGGDTIDLRGKINLWEVAKEISESSRFIGVKSGLMQIANCYPRVDNRLFLTEFPRESLLKWYPGDMRNLLFSWADATNMYFNRTVDDIGLTYSYTKI